MEDNSGSWILIYTGMAFLVGGSLGYLHRAIFKVRFCSRCGERLGSWVHPWISRCYCRACLEREPATHRDVCSRCGESGDKLQVFCPQCFKIYVVQKHSEELQLLKEEVMSDVKNLRSV